MRLQKTVASLISALLSIMSTALPLHAAAPADAPAKQRLCKPCVMPKLPTALPRHGMVLGYWSFMSIKSSWYTVDLDLGVASRAVVSTDRKTKTADIVEHTTRPISPDDLVKLKQIASQIWGSTDSLPTHMATDIGWSLWQLDGDDVRVDSGPGMPDGLAKEAVQIMQRVAGKPAPN